MPNFARAPSDHYPATGNAEVVAPGVTRRHVAAPAPVPVVSAAPAPVPVVAQSAPPHPIPAVRPQVVIVRERANNLPWFLLAVVLLGLVVAIVWFAKGDALHALFNVRNQEPVVVKAPPPAVEPEPVRAAPPVLAEAVPDTERQPAGMPAAPVETPAPSTGSEPPPVANLMEGTRWTNANFPKISIEFRAAGALAHTNDGKTTLAQWSAVDDATARDATGASVYHLSLDGRTLTQVHGANAFLWLRDGAPVPATTSPAPASIAPPAVSVQPPQPAARTAASAASGDNAGLFAKTVWTSVTGAGAARALAFGSSGVLAEWDGARLQISRWAAVSNGVATGGRDSARLILARNRKLLTQVAGRSVVAWALPRGDQDALVAGLNRVAARHLRGAAEELAELDARFENARKTSLAQRNGRDTAALDSFVRRHTQRAGFLLKYAEDGIAEVAEGRSFFAPPPRQRRQQRQSRAQAQQPSASAELWSLKLSRDRAIESAVAETATRFKLQYEALLRRAAAAREDAAVIAAIKRRIKYLRFPRNPWLLGQWHLASRGEVVVFRSDGKAQRFSADGTGGGGANEFKWEPVEDGENIGVRCAIDGEKDYWLSADGKRLAAERREPLTRVAPSTGWHLR